MRIINKHKAKAWISCYWTWWIYLLPTVALFYSKKKNVEDGFTYFTKLDIGDEQYKGNKLNIMFIFLGTVIDIDIWTKLEKL